MALQSSGAISLDDIHDEAGGTSGSTATINDADIRGLISKSAGASMAFNEWYGASSSLDIGMFAQGYGSGVTNVIDYVTISSTGNASDWGDATSTAYYGGGHGNRTIGISKFSGQDPGLQTTIDYITWASQGDAADWGDCAAQGDAHTVGSGNSTRAIFQASTRPRSNGILYLSLSSTGNSADFGDMSSVRNASGLCSSTTRSVLMGGADLSGGNSSTVDTIEYVTIANTGNATDFGNLTAVKSDLSGTASATRGLTFCGLDGSFNETNVVEYITIASTGNATDFGDASATGRLCMSSANATRAVVCFGAFGATNRIDYFTIANTGNATDFGDLSVTRGAGAGLGDSQANAA